MAIAVITYVCLLLLFVFVTPGVIRINARCPHPPCLKEPAKDKNKLA